MTQNPRRVSTLLSVLVFPVAGCGRESDGATRVVVRLQQDRDAAGGE